MIKDLVSIITPCYNGEKTISRLMDSVLNQTYKKIEFILVNDGSTDKTEEIANSYKQKFADSGMVFKYVYQENKGLGGAINTGLKHFTGDFLCWPDADDYLELTSVEERMNFLKNNPDYAVVTSNAYIRNENNLDNPELLVKRITESVSKSNQFDLLLNGDSIFCSGCHMVRTEAFLQVNPQREIYPARRGQNWQLLLPLYYKYNRYFLDKPLYNYVIYQNSMSRNDTTMEKQLFRYNEHETILVATLKQIEENLNVDLHRFYNLVTDKYFKLRLSVALSYNDKKYFDEQYLKKQETVGLDFQDRFLHYRRRYKILNHIYNIAKRIKTKL